MKTIYLASNNKNKLIEMNDMLKDLNFRVLPASILKDIDVLETGSTYYENAKLKAEAYLPYTDQWILADDSGIEISALDNQPGIYSARYLGEISYAEKCQIVLDKIRNAKDRSACYISCLILLKGSKEFVFNGKLSGNIAFEAKGSNGFGYDPIFLVSKDKTMAEITDEEKYLISHRAIALKKLKEFLVSNHED
ncbi:MAG: RdgB/HAM1 family non-canonical purine NTP pyrophosphatase [Erysipelotrichaceae bacterium]